jgi:predicted double-glycine peptidase
VNTVAGLRCILGCVLAFAACVTAHAGSVSVRVPYSGSYAIHLTSLKEARFKTTVRQQYDFSCGSAATATLLTYQYGYPVTEAEVFRQMYANGDQARIRKQGFSLLDMRRYLQSLGFQADGFELPLDKLFEEGLPAIVLLNDRGYRHFVVVKGLRRGRVLVGDPARGTRAHASRCRAPVGQPGAVRGAQPARPGGLQPVARLAHRAIGAAGNGHRPAEPAVHGDVQARTGGHLR